MITSIDQILEEVKNTPPRTVAIAQAADEDVLAVADRAHRLGLTRFKLCAEPGRMAPLLEKGTPAWVRESVVEITDDAEAARKAVDMVNAGEADTVMKGNLKTGTFLKALLDKEKGLRHGNNLFSQCGVYDNPLTGRLLFISDCAVNIAPDLAQKKQILENVAGLAHTLGIENPKAGLLAALETINPDMPETVDAAALSKMAERGQIQGCVVDGPLAMDNILNAEFARIKGFSSPVSGDADIIIAPNVLTGNAVHKTIAGFTSIKNAALCLGARVPVIMTSRTDRMEIKLASIALACLIS